MKKMFLAFLVFFLIFSCSKDEQVLLNNDNSVSYRESRSNQGQNHKFDEHQDTLIRTVLGGELNNPFTVENLQRALLSLCDNTPDTRIQIRTTDRQIKFKPKNYEEVKKIFRDTSLVLFDFPLNKEVIYMGDYFVNSCTEEEIPEFYSFVEIGQPLPNGVSYEVIEEYDYEVDNPLLIAESFRLTDNFEFVNDYIFPEDIENEIEICGIIMIPPDDIECPLPCVPVLVIDDSQVDKRGKAIYSWECDCSSNAGNGETNPPINDCGCPTYSEQRKPAGCINVENNSNPTNPFEGVRKVRVSIRDYRFGKSYKTWTNENGCWKINKRCEGKIWMWVEFKNSESYERCWIENFNGINGIENYKVLQLLKPVKDYVGFFSGPNFSNIEVIYRHWGTQVKTQAQRYWGAATINNEVQFYIEHTGDIVRPPSNLDIYLQPTERSGAAIMGTYWPNIEVQALIPDLSIGLNFRTRGEQDALSFHEIAHTSHFSQVGIWWWNNLIVQEIANSQLADGTLFIFNGDPHGQGDEPNAGYVALAESWADNVSTDLTLDSQEGEIFENGYIPTGLFHDLNDNTPFEIVRLGIFDRVNGFTRRTMFNSLNSNVTTINQYQQDLINSLPVGNTIVDYNDLFAAYTP